MNKQQIDAVRLWIEVCEKIEREDNDLDYQKFIRYALIRIPKLLDVLEAETARADNAENKLDEYIWKSRAEALERAIVADKQKCRTCKNYKLGYDVGDPKAYYYCRQRSTNYPCNWQFDETRFMREGYNEHHT